MIPVLLIDISIDTVDEINPARVERWPIPLFIGLKYHPVGGAGFRNHPQYYRLTQ